MKKDSIRAKHLDFIIIDILCLFSTLWLSYLLWIPEREKGSRGDDYRAIGLVLVLAYLFIVFTRPAHSGILRRSVLKELRQTLPLNEELLTIHELFTTYRITTIRYSWQWMNWIQESLNSSWEKCWKSSIRPERGSYYLHPIISELWKCWVSIILY